MTPIPIPDKAVEAAHNAFMDSAAQPNGMHDPEGAWEAALTAAAPMIVGAQWVACSERMPEDQREVLGCLGQAQLRIVIYWSGSEWRYAWDGQPAWMTVTHWAPLLPPPRIDPEAT